MGKHLPQKHKDLGSIPRIKISERIYFKQFPSLLPKRPPLFQATSHPSISPTKALLHSPACPFVFGPPLGLSILGVNHFLHYFNLLKGQLPDTQHHFLCSSPKSPFFPECEGRPYFLNVQICTMYTYKSNLDTGNQVT